jgi:hypothetical protein
MMDDLKVRSEGSSKGIERSSSAMYAASESGRGHEKKRNKPSQLQASKIPLK